jgi:hypothetical protein
MIEVNVLDLVIFISCTTMRRCRLFLLHEIVQHFLLLLQIRVLNIVVEVAVQVGVQIV